MKIEIRLPKVKGDRWFQVQITTRRRFAVFTIQRGAITLTNASKNPATGDCYRSTVRHFSFRYGFNYVRAGQDKARPHGLRDLRNFRDFCLPSGRPIKAAS